MSGPDIDERRPRAEARTPGPSTATAGSFTGRALVLALVAATLLVTLAVPVRSWFAQRAEIAGLRADVDAARERVSALQIEKERWDDPAFVAAEARRRLHFVLPGEVGYVTLGVTEAAGSPDAVEGAGSPWYASLWGALQESDDHARATG